MEPLTVSALAATITTLLNSAADEAGKSAWTKLSTAVSRRFGHSSSEAVAIAQVEQAAITPGSEDLPVAASQAAEILLALAQRDQAIADLIGNLSPQITDNSTVVNNSISGTVSGPAIQTNTITGGITFNG
jgi:hypothetical protein